MMESSTQEFRRVHMPYCLEKTKDGTWIVLNRLYKPVGLNTGAWIDYEKHPFVAKIQKLTKAQIALISWTPNFNGTQVFLYDDGCIPTDKPAYMSAYLKRLAALMNLKVL